MSAVGLSSSDVQSFPLSIRRWYASCSFCAAAEFLIEEEDSRLRVRPTPLSLAARVSADVLLALWSPPAIQHSHTFMFHECRMTHFYARVSYWCKLGMSGRSKPPPRAPRVERDGAEEDYVVTGDEA